MEVDDIPSAGARADEAHVLNKCDVEARFVVLLLPLHAMTDVNFGFVKHSRFT